MDNLMDQRYPGFAFGGDAMRGYNAMGIANNARLQQLVLRHAQFPAIVDLAHDIQRQGALPAKQEEMSARHRQSMAQLRTCIAQSGGNGTTAKDESLDAFMGTYLDVLENYKNDITSTEQEVNELIKGFDAEIARILHDTGADHTNTNASGSRVDPATILVNLSDEEQGKLLIQKFGDQIMDIQAEHCVKRCRKVLPTAATTILKKWWNAHFVWPYPTDAEKSLLSEQTKLDVTQVNNWLINQRKRGWHKHFPGGVPKSEEEAMELLRLRGVNK